MKTLSSTSNNESEKFRELIQHLGLPLKYLPEIISQTPMECLSWWSRHPSQVHIKPEHFDRLALFLGIEKNQLLTSDYDLTLARRRIYGDLKSLPDKYQHNQNSYLRSSLHIMKYLELTRGRLFADQILCELNLSPLIYQDADTRINLTYFSDLLSQLAKKGLSQLELDSLGGVISMGLKDKPLGQKLSHADNHFEVYKIIASSFDFFDNNFDYKSQFIGNKYILKTTLPIANHPGISPENFNRLMRYRLFLLAWFPYVAGLGPVLPVVNHSKTKDILITDYEFSLRDTPRQLKPLLTPLP